MKKIRKKLISIFMVACMLFSLVPHFSAAAAATTRLCNLKQGDKITFGGYNWIVLDPSTGYLLMDRLYTFDYVWHYYSAPFSTVSGGLNWLNTYEQYNIASMLNCATVDFESMQLQPYGNGFMFPGFLASMAHPMNEQSSPDKSADYLKMILLHTWSTGPRGYESRQSLNTDDAFKVGLLSYDEYNKYKNVHGLVLPGQEWWLRTGEGDLTQYAWAVDGTGNFKEEKIQTNLGIRPAMYVNANTFCTATDTAGQYDVLLPQPDAVAMPASANITFAPGTYAGLTSLTAKPTLAGGKLAVQLSKKPITTPENAFMITDIAADPGTTGIVYPYLQGSDIGHADPGDYVGVYDLDNKGHVYAFTQHQLTAAEIKQVAPNTREQLKYMGAGSILHFAGYEWVLLNPATGYLLMKDAYSREACRYYHDDGPFDEYLNSLTYATDYPNIKYSSEGFYKHLNETYPKDISLIQDHEWTQNVINSRNDWGIFGTNTIESKIGLLSYSEFGKYRSIIPPLGTLNNYWLMDRVYQPEPFVTVDMYPDYNLAFYATVTGFSGPDYDCYQSGVRPAIYLDPSIEVYTGNNNVVRAVPDLKTAPTAATGTAEGTTTITAVPNTTGNMLKYERSSTDIIPPEINTTAPADAVTSSKNIPAVPGDYIGVYEVDSSNTVVSFGELQLTDSTCSPATLAISPTGTFDTPPKVTISFANTDGNNTAYYTKDGTDPDTSTTKIKYTAPFIVDKSMTVKAQVYNSNGGGWSKVTTAGYGLPSSISLTAATFDLNPTADAHQDIPVTVALAGNTLVSIQNGDATLNAGTDYTVSDDGSLVTIKTSYLSGLAHGDTDLTFNFNMLAASNLIVTVIDTRYQDSTVSATNIFFDKNPNGSAYTDLPVTVQLNGNTLLDIKNVSNAAYDEDPPYQLVEGTDYTITDNGSGSETVTLTKSCITNLNTSSYKVTLAFDFSNGKTTKTPTLGISVIDTRTRAKIMARDAQGNLYAMGASTLFMIPKADGTQWGIPVKAGKVCVLAGNGTSGYAGDNGPVSGATFRSPLSVSIDPHGNIYILDYMNKAIREIAAANGTQWGIKMKAGYIYTVVSPDPKAGGYLNDMTVDADGDIIYTSSLNNEIMNVLAAVTKTKFGIDMEAGKTYTIAGINDGSKTYFTSAIVDGKTATQVHIVSSKLTTDKAGNVYFYSDNSVYMIAAADGTYFNRAMTAGKLYWIAGTDTPGYTGDGGNAQNAGIGEIKGIAVDVNGNLFIADGPYYSVIREVACNTMTQNGVSLTAGNIYTFDCTTGKAIMGSTSNTGNAGGCTQGVFANGTGGIWYPNSNLGTFAVTDLAITSSAYTVTYDANGGSGTALSQEVNATFAAAENTFTAPDGKQFKEWNTAPDGTGTVYSAGAAVMMPAGTLTLYAIWIVPVNSITVTGAGNATSVATGGTLQMSATVLPADATDSSVTWSVSGNNSTGTAISSSGVLMVGADETATTLTVKAASTVDTGKSGTATVTVTAVPTPTPTVSSVAVTPATITVNTGDHYAFGAQVNGTNSPDQTVTWSVSCKNSGSTTIGTDGKLTVGADETASTLTVTATSTVDTGKSGTATVTVNKVAPVAPAITITENPFKNFAHFISFGLFFNDSLIHVSISSTSSNIDHYEYQKVAYGDNYDPNGTWTKADSFSISPEFKGTVYARAVAKNGAVSEVTVKALVVDQTKPAITATYSEADDKISVGVTDTGAGINTITYKVGNASAQTINLAPTETKDITTSNSFDIASLPNGKYNVTIDAVDNSGNAAETKTVAVIQGPIVDSVSVTPPTASVDKGSSKNFAATIVGENSPATTVTWSVSGNSSNDTKIGTDGKLIVGTDETAATLTVTATSTVDTGVSGTATVTVTTAPPPTPTVSSVAVTPATITVNTGDNYTFGATVAGTNSPDQTVTWSVSGKNSANTTIGTDGKLTVGADETATSLTVTATSTVDTGKAGTATVTVNKVAPAAPAINITENPFKSFAHFISFGLFFNDSLIHVSISSASANIDHYEYQKVASGDNYDPNGTWTKADSFSISPEFKGTVHARAVTKNGAASDVTVKALVVDQTKPAIAATYSEADDKISVGVTDTGAGINTITYKVGSADAQTINLAPTDTRDITTSNNFDIASLPNGQYFVTIDAVDNSGNVAETKTIAIDRGATVTSVTVTPSTASVKKGGTQSFSAQVVGSYDPAQTVTWSVSGNNSASTKMNSSGVLTVGADETASTLTVKAASTVNSAKSGTTTVTVTSVAPPTPTVSNVSVTPPTATALVGGTQTFSAKVTGTNSPDQTVTWNVSGSHSSSTAIGTDGKLTVGADEMASSLTVTATSTVDTGKSGTATVTVSKPRSFTGIEMKSLPTKINYVQGDSLDLTGAALSLKYSDNSTKTVTLQSSMVSGFDSSNTGSEKITVTYNGKSTSFDVNIIPAVVSNTEKTATVNIAGADLPAGVTSVTVSGGIVSNSGTDSNTYGSVNTLLTQNNAGFSIGGVNLLQIELLDQNGKPITGFGKVTVRLPIPEGMSGDLHVYWYDPETHALTDMNAKQIDGFLVFETTHFSTYAVAQLKVESTGSNTTTTTSSPTSNPKTGETSPNDWLMLAALPAGLGLALAVKKRKLRFKRKP